MSFLSFHMSFIWAFALSSSWEDVKSYLNLGRGCRRGIAGLTKILARTIGTTLTTNYSAPAIPHTKHRRLSAPFLVFLHSPVWQRLAYTRRFLERSLATTGSCRRTHLGKMDIDVSPLQNRKPLLLHLFLFLLLREMASQRRIPATLGRPPRTRRILHE